MPCSHKRGRPVRHVKCRNEATLAASVACQTSGVTLLITAARSRCRSARTWHGTAKEFLIFDIEAGLQKELRRHYRSTMGWLKLMQASAKSLGAVAEQDNQHAPSCPSTRMTMEEEAFDKHWKGDTKVRKVLDERGMGFSVVWLMLERISKVWQEHRRVLASGHPPSAY